MRSLGKLNYSYEKEMIAADILFSKLPSKSRNQGGRSSRVVCGSSVGRKLANRFLGCPLPEDLFSMSCNHEKRPPAQLVEWPDPTLGSLGSNPLPRTYPLQNNEPH